MKIIGYIDMAVFAILFGMIVLAGISQTFKCWIGWDMDDLVWDYEREGMTCPNCGYFEC